MKDLKQDVRYINRQQFKQNRRCFKGKRKCERVEAGCETNTRAKAEAEEMEMSEVEQKAEGKRFSPL